MGRDVQTVRRAALDDEDETLVRGGGGAWSSVGDNAPAARKAERASEAPVDHRQHLSISGIPSSSERPTFPLSALAMELAVAGDNPSPSKRTASARASMVAGA
jgi:hypothetical protein